VPKDAFVFDKHRDSLLGKLRNRVSSAWTSWLLQRADCCKLLYPQQLEGLEIRSLKRVRSFADLVPISQIQSKSSDEKYLLCIGVPWHLKGVDTLIEAFKRLRSKFPTWHLKLYGHCEDRGYFERLIGDTPQIEMGQGVSRAEAIELISGCSILVLPSRTEAMGRVLLEALAARKPIVASRVGGIPHIIEHEHNGLLFDAEDVDGLVEQLERLMSKSTYAMDIGERGFTDVHQRLNEERYVSNYMEMVDETLRG
jgi:glycosyltransferase involved in cell wall biosynthesis